MDPAETRLIQLVFIKEKGAEGFKKNPPAPHPPRALQIIRASPCFLISRLYNNLDSCGEYSLRTWIISFFIPQFTLVSAPISASKTHPSAID